MTAVPIVVTSTTDDYFVLYVSHELDADTTVHIPVSVTRGETGSTTLAENVEALPAARYKVEKYPVATPADVDGDCTDDLTELDSLGSMNPVNPAAEIAISDGAVAVPDRATFDTLSNSTTVKFVLYDLDTARPGVYFINTDTHSGHADFFRTSGVERRRGQIRGDLTYSPDLLASNGSPGAFYYSVGPHLPPYPFRLQSRIFTVLAASLPLLTDNLLLHFRSFDLLHEYAQYQDSRITLVFDDDVHPEDDFLALNTGVGFGRLRSLEPDERPHPRDIVVYETLPNELSKVAGIVSTVPQTPLSHVNLRAKQDRVPNAFIRDALDDADISGLLGSYVRYEVTSSRFTVRAATPAEVDAHYASQRPTRVQVPQRDLSVTEITPLSDIGFADWKAFGVKAANVAVLRTLGFPAGTVPDGFAIPFYFYDRFMQETALGEETVLGKKSAPDEEKITLAAETTLAAAVTAMLAHPVFQTDFAVQEEMLDDLRDAIKDATSPQFIIDALTAMHTTYPEGQSLRYRSSTNNEDLPGFNGAGLYDSYTQKPEETEEDGIDKSLKQVFASLWNFRAFSEREFHRVDHTAAAMGVLVHPNYTDEKANGVAVSFDPITSYANHYYVNTQLGEDLVTNPAAHSIPEELLLKKNSTAYSVLGTSNLVETGTLLMDGDQTNQLRRHLTTIHDHFKRLYSPAAGRPFAMEIEFKITSADQLAIKQARPWVFETSPASGGGSGSGGGGSGSSGGGGGGGGGARRDDHGNTPAQATAVTLDSARMAATAGQLHTAGDVDYFTLDVATAGVLVVETTGATDTVGTVWQDGAEVATDDNSGERRNFRLSVRVAAGPVVIAVAGTGSRTGAYTLQTTLIVGYLENPGADAFQSGIGVISGWVCAADEVEIELNGVRQEAGYGTERVDTESGCGDTDNGFGLLFNWSLLGDGTHAVVVYVDDVEFGRATVTVTTLGEEFVREVTGACVVEDFPDREATVTLAWQQTQQNFVIVDGARPQGANRAGQAGVGYLENPGSDSFQSGIGVISGWVCDAEAVEIEIGHLGRQRAAYGTERLDTEAVCGDTDNGFGLLFNWNLLGEGEHEVTAFVDDVELGRATVRVTTLGEEFVRGVEGGVYSRGLPESRREGHPGSGNRPVRTS